MAPEQIRGERLDERADLYSLAAVAFEVVTGRRLVDQSSLHATLFAVVNEPAPRVSTFVRGVSAAVDEAFLAALSKDPELRPRDVEAWVASFADALEAIPSDAPGWTRQIRRPAPP
jgi:serine/threonine protein kinase